MVTSVFPGGYLAIGTADQNIGLIEPTDAGYARQVITFTPLSAAVPCQNQADAVFGPAAAAIAAPITTAGLFSASAQGSCLVTWPLAAAVVLSAGQSYQVGAGTLELSFFDAGGLLSRGVTILQPGSNVALTGDQLPVTVWSTVAFNVAAAWPSGTASPAAVGTSPLTDVERVDVRRFLGYPAFGPGADGFQNWRFFDSYGTLEYRLTRITAAELSRVRTYLSQLATLEEAILTATGNLDTDQAAVWRHNRRELMERTTLFEGWRQRLAAFLGLPMGPEYSRGATGIGLIA